MNNLIFDIGANLGQDTDFYLKLGYEVIAVDANPEMCDHLKNRFRQEVQSTQLKVVRGVIGGTGKFYVNPDKNEWSSIDEGSAGRGMKVFELAAPVLDVRDLVHWYGVPEYCKIDIEGADWLVVRAFEEVEPLPTYMSFEIGDDGYTNAVLDDLIAMGYKEFQLVNQAFVTWMQSHPLLERFEDGATGLFGPYLKGEWFSKEIIQLLILYRDRNPGYWYDIHARQEKRNDG